MDFGVEDPDVMVLMLLKLMEAIMGSPLDDMFGRMLRGSTKSNGKWSIKS